MTESKLKCACTSDTFCPDCGRKERAHWRKLVDDEEKLTAPTQEKKD